MNKRYWISVALDDTLSDEEVLELIERSWNLTTKKKMKHFKDFQLAKYSLLKKFSENIGFFLTSTFAYAKNTKTRYQTKEKVKHESS